MRKIITGAIMAACMMGTTPLAANEPTQALATCMIDSLNGKERKELAKWIFLAMGSHPEIQSLSSATTEDMTQSNKAVGQLISRLLLEDCPEQLKVATNANSQALSQGFELVGKVAMQELMTNENVTNALTGYINYTRMNDIQQLLSQ